MHHWMNQGPLEGSPKEEYLMIHLKECEYDLIRLSRTYIRKQKSRGSGKHIDLALVCNSGEI